MGQGASDKERVTVRLTADLLEAVDKLDGRYGNNRGEKLRFIVQDWVVNKPTPSSKPAPRKRGNPEPSYA